MSVPSSELGPPPPPASECVSPFRPKGRRSSTCLQVRRWGDPIQTTYRRPGTLYTRCVLPTARLQDIRTRGGQTPWPNGRPADIDSISDQWSKFRNIAIFSQKIRKDLNLNIDQSLDIWSKPSKDRNFLRKKIKRFKSRSWTFKAP